MRIYVRTAARALVRARSATHISRASLWRGLRVRYFFVLMQFSKLRSDFNSGLYSNAGAQRAILRRNFALHQVFSRRETGQSVHGRDGSNRKYIVRSSISQLKFSRPRRFFPTFTIVPAFYPAERRSSKERILFVKGCKSLHHVIN